MLRKIPNSISVHNLDKLYLELDNCEHQIDLSLPSEIKSWDFGITTLLIQFFSTWVRSKAAGKIILGIKEDNSDLESMVSLDVNFPAIIMSWDKGIIDGDSANIKSKVRLINEAIIKSMLSLENLPLFNKSFIPQKGFKSLLTCFDHLPAEKGLLGCFYSNKEFILSENTLADTLEETLTYILSFNSQSAKVIKPIKRDLIEIIYELMKNTHDWGRTDISNKALNPNVRGTYIKFIKKNKNLFIENYGDHLGFQSYFNGLQPSKNNELYFIEISVFDSGVGFVEKYSGKPSNTFTSSQQVDIIKECLIKNNTSDQTLAKYNKGLGLDRIMQILDKKGLFFIRTSNVFVARNMKDNHYMATKKKEEIELFDFKTYSSKDYTYHSKSVGSSITIVYPLPID